MEVRPELIGRGEDLATIRRALAGRLPCRAVVIVLVAGEAGIGKSALVRSCMAEERQSGTAVLEGTCLDMGATVPFAPVLEALRPLLLGNNGRSGVEQFGYSGRVAAGLYGHVEVPTVGVSAGQALHCLREVITASASRTRTLLVLEDLHWGDSSTHELVRLLGQASGNLGVLLTYRIDEAERSGSVAELLHVLRRTAQVVHVQLSPLGQADIGAIAAARLGRELDPTTVAAVTARSSGNPFFALALLDAGVPEGVPRQLALLLRAQVDALGAGTRDVLRAASVGGSRVDAALLWDALGVPKADVERALREAVAARVLDSGRHLLFRHALIREAVYAGLLPSERAALHEQFARGLCGVIGASSRVPVSLLAELAVHWDSAGRAPEALDAFCRAGLAAWRQGAAPEAFSHLERALALWDEVDDPEARAGQRLVDVLRLAGGAAGATGDNERASALIDRALEIADPAVDPFAASRTYSARGSMAAGFDDGLGSLEWVQRAVEVTPPGPSLERATALAVLAEHRINEGMAGEALALATEAVNVAAAITPMVGIDRRQELGGTHADALRIRGHALALTGRVEIGIASIREAVSVAELTAGRAHALFTQLALGDMLCTVGSVSRVAEGAQVFAKVGAAAAAAGLPGIEQSVGESQLALLLETGPFDSAQQQLDQLLRSGMNDWRGSRYQAICYAVTGCYGDSAAQSHEFVNHLVDAGRPLLVVSVVARHVEMLRRCGRVAESVGIARELVRQASAVDADMHRAYAASVAIPASLADTTGSPDATALLVEARALLSALERDADGGACAEGTYAAAMLATAQAWHARATGQGELGAWQNAAAAYAAAGSGISLLDTRVRLAEALLVHGDRDAARQLITETWAQAQAVGADGVVTELRQVARPIRLRLDESSAPFGVMARLTAREREVLELLSDGASNNRIAATLFISAKTASLHVSRVLAKLGVATRLEAAALHHRESRNSSASSNS